jgi:ABC-type uncharacterized transport system substrate-binding protein
MRRRNFVAFLGSAAVWPLATRAQQGDRVRRIGILTGLANEAEGQARIAAFRRGLEALGWVEGRTVRVDERWAAGESDLLQAHASELVGLRPDVILGTGSRVWTLLQRETRTIPIVSVGVPIALVEGLARPGGNATGFSIFEPSLIGKLLDLLKEAAPHVTRVTLLIHADTNVRPAYSDAFEAAAPLLAIKPIVAPVRDRADIARALDALAREPNGGVLVPPEIFVMSHRELVTTDNFCNWQLVLPRCRRYRASLGRKPIRRGRYAWSPPFPLAAQLTSSRA